MILAAVSVITGIMIILQTGSVYAASSEKIPLVQKYEQFPGQEITDAFDDDFDIQRIDDTVFNEASGIKPKALFAVLKKKFPWYYNSLRILDAIGFEIIFWVR